MLTTTYCYLMAGFAMMAAAAEWSDLPGAAALLALLAVVALIFGTLPLTHAVVPIG